MSAAAQQAAAEQERRVCHLMLHWLHDARSKPGPGQLLKMLLTCEAPRPEGDPLHAPWTEPGDLANAAPLATSMLRGALGSCLHGPSTARLVCKQTITGSAAALLGS